eukprot:scaffold48865_cov21-Prasinocladus_malaysianus.AAC.3
MDISTWWQLTSVGTLQANTLLAVFVSQQSPDIPNNFTLGVANMQVASQQAELSYRLLSWGQVIKIFDICCTE